MKQTVIVWFTDYLTMWLIGTFGCLFVGCFAWIPFGVVLWSAIGLGIIEGNWVSNLLYPLGVAGTGGLYFAWGQNAENHPKSALREIREALALERNGRLLLVNQLESDLRRKGLPDVSDLLESSEFAPAGLRSATLNEVGKGNTRTDEFERLTPTKEPDEGLDEE